MSEITEITPTVQQPQPLVTFDVPPKPVIRAHEVKPAKYPLSEDWPDDGASRRVSYMCWQGGHCCCYNDYY
ncbi:hypothetical protein HDV04_001014 [Boothiomyces sp. JEL0838]|nr:hypothetical protein HDV04_001014 [Boothiomyces sp. JEL0838]